MRYLSLFSGIEAASAAWGGLGWKPVGFAEVDPFACAVLAARYPRTPNLGDVTKIDAWELRPGPHVVVGGFPCQDVSKAGKREGLKHRDGSVTRSGLFFEADRIIRESGARWAVIENVPGLLSSPREARGEDFATVVGTLVGCDLRVPDGGWRSSGVAAGPRGLVEWAVLDARWFGVPQRRKRLFLVADFGAWHDRPPVLLEPESLRGDPCPLESRGEEAGPVAGGGAVRAGGDLVPFRKSRRAQSAQHPETWERSDFANCLNVFDVGERDTHIVVETKTARARRLTPLDAERIMGFPDYWTNVTVKGKPASDGKRMKAIGNSMAVPVMRWIGMRLQQAHRHARKKT